MMPSVETLSALVPPPTARRRAPAWTIVESQLGIRLPGDYKSLVEIYGAGSFDDFLWVLQPLDPNENLDLLTQRKGQLAAMRELWAGGEVAPFPIVDGHEPLLPWAFTDNGDFCYWIVDPLRDPTSWGVAVNESRGDRWYMFDGPACDFLVAVLSGSVQVPLFPADFPSARPTFVAVAS